MGQAQQIEHRITRDACAFPIDDDETAAMLARRGAIAR
jgi:hypothetical protein